MNKVIVMLSGTPQGKNALSELLKQQAWVWDINPKNALGAEMKNPNRQSPLNFNPKFYWNGERDATYYKYLSDWIKILNKHFDYEAQYIEEKIQSFNDDTDEEKKSLEGKTFNNFVLVIHGISPQLIDQLKEEHGALRVIIVAPSTEFYNEQNQNVVPENVDFVVKETQEEISDFVTNLLK